MKFEKNKFYRPLKMVIISLIFMFSLPSFAAPENTYLRPELDFNGDCRVDLSDAITGMKVLTGIDADIHGEKKIGIKEIIHILQEEAQIIPEPDYYDEYEEDDHSYQARVIVINNSADEATNGHSVQRHNFHDSGDEDWVMFYGLAGEIYTVEVNVEGIGSPCDVVIELYDTDGVTLIKSENDGNQGKDECLLWKSCPVDAIYYVRLRNYDPQVFGDDIEYDLVVRNPEAPFPGDIIGDVLDADTGKKITKAMIKTDANRTAISNYCHCYFYCRRDYCIYLHPPGTYTLTVTAPGYETYQEEVVVHKLQTTIHDVYMEPLRKFPLNNMPFIGQSRDK